MNDEIDLPSPNGSSQFDWGPKPYTDEEIEERAKQIVESQIDNFDGSVPSADSGVGGPSRAGNTIPPDPEQPFYDATDTILPPPVTVIDPAHYRQHPSGVECIEITEHLGFCVGNAIKYLWRAGLKDGTSIEHDLRKAIWYIDRELKRLGFES